MFVISIIAGQSANDRTGYKRMCGLCKKNRSGGPYDYTDGVLAGRLRVVHRDTDETAICNTYSDEVIVV
jgi:hypothetical protein